VANTRWSSRAAQKGWLDEKRVVLEVLTAFNAPARYNLTYHAKDAAKWLSPERHKIRFMTTPQMSPAKKRPRSAEIFGRAEQILVAESTVPVRAFRSVAETP